MAKPQNAKMTTGQFSSPGSIVIQTESDWSSSGKPSVTFERAALGVAWLWNAAGISSPCYLVVDVYDYNTGAYVKTVISSKSSFKVDKLGENTAYTLKVSFDMSNKGTQWTWRINNMRKSFVIGIDGVPIQY